MRGGQEQGKLSLACIQNGTEKKKEREIQTHIKERWYLARRAGDGEWSLPVGAGCVQLELPGCAWGRQEGRGDEARGCLSCLSCLALETQKTNHSPRTVPLKPSTGSGGALDSGRAPREHRPALGQEGVPLKWFVGLRLSLIYLMEQQNPFLRQILRSTPQYWAEWFSVPLLRAVPPSCEPWVSTHHTPGQGWVSPLCGGLEK